MLSLLNLIIAVIVYLAYISTSCCNHPQGKNDDD